MFPETRAAQVEEWRGGLAQVVFGFVQVELLLEALDQVGIERDTVIKPV